MKKAKQNKHHSNWQQLMSGASIACLILSNYALAQEEDTSYLDEVIVVGTAGGAGVNRLDAAFAVTTIDSESLTKISPKSTADLLKSIPGVWAESSSGVAGANIDVRGLPGGGDAPFVTIALNGMPIYGTSMLSFFEQSSIFRVDETIASVAGLRGGPNAVFGKGEPGLTVDFTLKEGSEETEGLMKVSTSDFGEQRIDGVLSGELAEDLFFMIGGYVRASDGVRDTQFKSENGQQFTVNLTKILEKGKVNMFARVTDDHGQWVLPMALNIGNNLGTFSALGNATRFRELQVNGNGDTEIFDFANGRGWDGMVAGASAEFDLGNGFTLRERLSFTSGDASTFGFVPDGSPVQVSSVGGATTFGGVTLAADDYIQNYGHWVVIKDMEAISNDLSLNKVVGNHDITFGYYQSTWSSDDFWTLGNFTPIHAVTNGDLLDSNITCSDLQTAGSGSGCWAYGIESAGDARVDALYLADSWQLTEALRLDVGVRHERIDLDYTLDSGPGYPDGVRDANISRNDEQYAYTAALNYDFNSKLGSFIRYSSGFTWPHFDNLREGNESVKDIEQLDAGLKYVGDHLQLFATAFYNTNDSFNAVVGSSVNASEFRTRALGLELDGDIQFGDFSTDFIVTIQDTEITDSTTVADEGNSILRQPDFQARISPQYAFEVAGLDATIYGSASFIGERYGDNANMVDLPSYEKIDLGLLLNSDNGLFFQIHADNLTDSDGLTEGDPRNPLSPNGRPIFGKSVKFSLGYNF